VLFLFILNGGGVWALSFVNGFNVMIETRLHVDFDPALGTSVLCFRCRCR
jgi:hypothetical protein